MYRLNEEKVFYDIAEGQAVVINFTTGVYYAFSSLGSEVLDRLIKGDSFECVLKAVQACDGCPEGMAEQLKAYISRLIDAEIILETPEAGNTNADPLPGNALMDGFELFVDEHSEVKDILMADPIHDVDVDMGWPIMKEDN